MCYDGLSASAPSGRKTADSEPFTVPGWSQLTEDFTILRSHGPFFLEIFAGQAGITEAVQLMGVPALPPVDVVVSELVSEAADVLDLAVWETIMAIIAARLVFLLHCGTPCNTFTAARKDDGGPPPLRSRDAPLGLPGLSWQNQALVFMGNLFLIRTCEACTLVFNLGGNSSSTTHELWLLILINVPLGLRPRSPHVCCAQLNISRCSRYFVQEGTCTSL